jgi:hypothetical protein
LCILSTVNAKVDDSIATMANQSSNLMVLVEWNVVVGDGQRHKRL